MARSVSALDCEFVSNRTDISVIEIPVKRFGLMTRIAFSTVLLTTALLAPLGAQPTGRLGPKDGLLAVTVDGKQGFIDLAGRMVIPPTFDFAWQFSEGRASAWENGRAGFIDRTGRFVIPARFEYAKAFHEGLAEVQLGGLWGFVGTDGQLTIQPQFEATLWFSEGRAPVRVDGRWGYVDRAGMLVIPAQYQQASLFENGRAFVHLEKEWIAINRNGERTSRDPGDLISEQRMGKWGFVTPAGEVAVDFKYDGVLPFSEGLAAVQVGERWGFIDRRGRLVIPAEFENGWPTPPGGASGGPPIGSFKEGLAAVFKDGSWRFIDAKGQAIPGRFVKAAAGNYGFRDGIASVCGKKTCGYIDRTGRVVWPWE